MRCCTWLDLPWTVFVGKRPKPGKHLLKKDRSIWSQFFSSRVSSLQTLCWSKEIAPEVDRLASVNGRTAAQLAKGEADA